MVTKIRIVTALIVGAISIAGALVGFGIKASGGTPPPRSAPAAPAPSGGTSDASYSQEYTDCSSGLYTATDCEILRDPSVGAAARQLYGTCRMQNPDILACIDYARQGVGA